MRLTEGEKPSPEDVGPAALGHSVPNEGKNMAESINDFLSTGTGRRSWKFL